MNKKEVLETRRVRFVFSDGSRDSQGTVLDANGWDLKRFNKNGVAFFNHRSSSNNPDDAIGTAKAWVEGDKLMGEIEFEPEELNPIAEKVLQKIVAGTYRAVSVGFIPLERGKWTEVDKGEGGVEVTYHYGKRSLVEISVVGVPSNANALVRSFSDGGIETDNLTVGEMRWVEAPLPSPQRGEGPLTPEGGIESLRMSGEEILARAVIGLMGE